ncbi:uncharacterized protein LOC128987073 [Macrosteles quadrilineatus]|uniref:uncharacterized protein LOC128987073 n=1 Tax=Macrosteles quadrilineatus TaxID=74068 RepID=UPI0023E32C65|nr:uncharacterized protein LOC128987073 [Macrosteles quadrilineatus]XP_054263740.1 uncharacterized protein LOC128987073 [Macrosteles quadrilineatus]
MNISVPKVKTCCFFCSLRNGTKFFGWFYLVSCLFGILGEVYLFSFYLAHSTNFWLRTIMFTDILLKSMQATFSLFLLLGAYQKQARYILWWVISNSVLTLLGIIGLTMLLVTLHVITSTVVFYVFSNLVDIYSILVVYSYYYEISENLPV